APIVDLPAGASVSPALREPLRLAQHPTPLVVVPEDRDDDHLDRGDAGRQPQPLRVAVGHDQSADEPGGCAPGRRFREVLLAVTTEVLPAVSLGEVLA